ncbi:TPA: glycoside hydrolase family 15 protein, partial [Candidatus Woesearchaeota archaeon]|nr:glycoside hydrolase family 15 protein [Candidatus Woesearchaeota archaeon]
MTRHFVLGNKNILVGLDNHGRIRDFYYPYVGQENHVNGKIHRFGIWVDGKFSWLEDPTWQKKLSYQNETLITHVLARNDDVGLEIELCSGITPNHGIFLRHVRITNLWDSTREIRLFFHQQFDVSEGNIGDTVYYNPLCKSIIHYKGKRYFLMNGSMQNGDKRKGNTGIAEYATGLVGEYGREGTWRDAEDGVLSNNPVEHGSVDSTVAFHGSIAPRKTTEMHYWICVADSYKSVSELHEHVLKETPATLLEEIGKYWRTWVNKTKFKFPKLRPEVVDLFKRSLLIINTHVDKRGAIIASSDSEMLHLRKDTYSYMWPRDGALIARSLDRAGYSDITEPFFAFCNTALSDDGYLFHKYRPDGSLGSSWHSWVNEGHIQLPIQEDESALVVYALWKHFELHGDQEYIEPFLESL